MNCLLLYMCVSYLGVCLECVARSLGVNISNVSR